MASQNIAWLSQERRLPESNRWKVPERGYRKPPKHEHPHQQTPHTQHLADALTDRLNQATSETEPGRI